MKPMYRTPPRVIIGIGIFVALILPSIARGQATVGLMTLPFCGSVSPNTIGAKIQTNISGTSTPLASYTDSTGTVQNQNPVTLTGNSAIIWGLSGNLYRFVVTDANSVQQCIIDGLSPIGGGGGSGSANWSALLPGTNSNSGTFIASGNIWDFSAANLFKLPVAAGITPSAPGSAGYDSSGNKWVFFQNGAQIGFGLTSSACAANQFVNTPATATAAASCAQPSAANLSNGTTGSGAVVLATSPTIATSTLTTPTINSGIVHGGTGFQHMRWTGCALSASPGSTCNSSNNWPTAFADTNYTVACVGVPTANNTNLVVAVYTKSTTALTINEFNNNSASSTPEIDCIGVHD